jgi:hypothetical protein
MQARYDVGLALGRNGYPWAKAPPEVIVSTRGADFRPLAHSQAAAIALGW